MKIRLIMPILMFGIIIMGSPPAVYSISNQENMIDIKEIETLFSNKGTMIEFSRSPKYQREIEIVRNISGVAEYEAITGGVGKYADIGIALFDLNSDGQEEILAYVIQGWLCSAGEHGCSFLVLQRDQRGYWIELLGAVVPEKSIAVLPTRHNGYFDLVFNNYYEYPYEEAWKTILRYNRVNYDYFYHKNEKLDYFDRSSEVVVLFYDSMSKNWKLISKYKTSRH